MLTSVRQIRSTMLVAALAGVALVPNTARSADLRGSPRSMTSQHGVAVSEGYTFLRSSDQVRRFADEGLLVLLEGNDDYLVHGQVTHPYARPEVRLFIERLASQYRAATGERLVVTSLVRPTAEQPSNAHRLSVHPAGMAVDLRVPADASSRRWLEGALIGLEGAGVLDVTREYRPPHYHVAVFPEEYAAYAARRIDAEGQAARAREEAAAEAARAASRAPGAAAESERLAQAAALDLPASDGAGGLAAALMLVLGGGLVAIPLVRRRRDPGL